MSEKPDKQPNRWRVVKELLNKIYNKKIVGSVNFKTDLLAKKQMNLFFAKVWVQGK